VGREVRKMKVTIRKHEIKKFLYLMDENLPMCEKGRRTGNLRKMRVWAHTPELDCNEKRRRSNNG